MVEASLPYHILTATVCNNNDEPEENACIGPPSLQYLEQSLRQIYQEWQSSKNRSRALS